MSSGLDCLECGGFIDLERSDSLCYWCLRREREDREDDGLAHGAAAVGEGLER